MQYRQYLFGLIGRINHDLQTQLVPVLQALEPQYRRDSYAQTLEEVFENLREYYTNIDREAQTASQAFVGQVNLTNRQRFYSSMQTAIGVDLQTVLQREGLGDTIIAKTRDNVSLIRSIPEQYLKQIENVVFQSTVEGLPASNMLQEIKRIGRATHSRAKLIARDQSAKINSALNKTRQENLGVEEYIWRATGDERTRESHARNNGKIFRWDTPPKETGHPGHDIQCRCIAQPILNL